MTGRDECPGEQLLGDFLRGLLPEEQAARIEQHVRGCRDCGFVVSTATADDRTAPAGPAAARRAAFPSLGSRYQVDGLVGRGGMGQVYRAYDRELSRVVAIKVIGAERAGGEALERFRREVALASSVTHPNVLRVYDLAEHDGLHFLSMQLVEGEDLGELLAREGKLPLVRSLALFRQICEGVAAAHRRGVLHRDLKPRNVLVGRGDEVFVADFGLAKSLDGPTSADGRTVGTPAYMSPEQVRGEPLDPRSDVYALGVILFELVTGRVPFRGPSPRATMELRLDRPPPEVPPIDEEPRLAAVTARCLQPDPGARYPTAGELLEDLRAPERAPSARRARGAWLAATGFVLLAVASLAVTSRADATLAGEAADTAPAPSSSLSLRTTNIRRLTFEPGCQTLPAFVPHRDALVYAGTTGAHERLYLVGLDGSGGPRQITRTDGKDLAPAVSPDGARVVFRRTDAAGHGTYVQPLDGSDEPRLVAHGAGLPAWSHDGKGIWTSDGAVFTEYDAESFAVSRTVNANFKASTPHVRELADGSLIVLSPDAGRLLEISRDGQTRTLLDGNGMLQSGLALTSDEQHALVGRYLREKRYELVDVPLDGGPAAALTRTEIVPVNGIAVSVDGRRIAWSQCMPESSVMRVDARGQWSRALPAETFDIDTMSWAGAGALAIVSERSGEFRPWLVDVAGRSAPRPVPVGGAGSQQLAFSKDGSRFLACRQGSGLEVGWTDGRSPVVQLTSNPDDSAPSFARHETHALFTRHLADGRPQVMEVSLEGGTPVALLDPGSDWALTSPADDRTVVYLAGETSARQVPTVADLGSGSRRTLSPALPAASYTHGMSISLDGRRVALIRFGAELVEVDVTTGAVVRTAGRDSGDRLFTPTYTNDALLVVRLEWRGNIWTAETSVESR